MGLQDATPGYKTALWIVTAIAGAMFVAETLAGHLCGSHALKADALDFLDDALLYSMSLAMLGQSVRAGAVAAVLGAIALGIVSMWVLFSAIYHFSMPELPHAGIMGLLGGLGILANIVCVAVLAPYTGRRRVFRVDDDGDVPDIIGNAAVVLTAAFVWLLQSPWPDLLVAVIAAGQLLWLAIERGQSALAFYKSEQS